MWNVVVDVNCPIVTWNQRCDLVRICPIKFATSIPGFPVKFAKSLIKIINFVIFKINRSYSSIRYLGEGGGEGVLSASLSFKMLFNTSSDNEANLVFLGRWVLYVCLFCRHSFGFDECGKRNNFVPLVNQNRKFLIEFPVLKAGIVIAESLLLLHHARKFLDLF